MESLFLNVSFGPHRVAIPYHVLSGAAPGPRMFVSAGMHGGEINGIAVVSRFLDWAIETDLASRLRGTLVVLPVLNPSGFARMQRRVFEDDVDLNRVFDGREPTTLAEAMAAELTEHVLRHCDFGVDLHDASGDAALLPHVRVHRIEECGCTRAMGQAFGTMLLIEREGNKGMMAVGLNQRFKIPVLTVEIGGAQHFFPEFVPTGVQGIRNILIAKGMDDGTIVVPDRQFLLTRRYGVKTGRGVMVEWTRALGNWVHHGDVLGRLYYPQTGESTTIHAPMCGLIFALNQRSQASDGATLYSILEADDCHVKRVTTDAFAELGGLRVKAVRW